MYYLSVYSDIRELHRLNMERIQKDIEDGKCFQRSTFFVSSFDNRDPRLAESVVPPDPFDPVSKRRFDGLVKKWRRDLHMFDAKNDEERQEVEDWFMQQSVFLADVYMKQDFYPIYSHSC